LSCASASLPSAPVSMVASASIFDPAKRLLHPPVEVRLDRLHTLSGNQTTVRRLIKDLIGRAQILPNLICLR
jgi:hypothetical protein